MPTLEFSWYWVVLAVAVVGVTAWLAAHVLGLYREQRRLREALQAELVERRRADAVLEQERNLLRTLIDNLPDFIYIKDTESRFLLNNAAHRAYLGARSPEDVIGKTDFAFFSPPIAQKFYDDEQRIMTTGEPLIGREEPAVNAQGKRVWVSTTKVPIRDRDGRVVGIVGMSRDVTAHKIADDQLRHANSELADSRRKLLEMYSELKKSHEALKAAQMQLIQAEKMDSVGTLAAGVAHEVKNPLQTILMGVDYIATKLPVEDRTVRLVLSEMHNAVERADKITRGLLDYSASRQLDILPQDLNAVIRSSLFLVHHQLAVNHVQVVEELAKDLPTVRLDKQKIEQVLVNLLVNAIHAMPEGGTVTVRTYAKQVESGARDEGSRKAGRVRTGDTVVVAELDDSGTGISEKHLAKLFDPFFTTKPTGKGTGLGLCVARKILELHAAHIDVRNRPEGGVRVSLMFRASEAIGAPAGSPLTGPTQQPGRNG